MVDAGMNAREEAVEELFSRAGIEPRDVSLIIVTHVHPDHVGGLASAKSLTGARVLCHRSVAELIAKGRSEPIVAHGAWGAFIAAIISKRFRGVAAEILVDGERGLKDYGLDGRVIHARGHSPGSIAIVLSDGEVLVGDLVRGEGAELSLGRFYVDEELALRNLESVVSAMPRLIHLSHGTSTDASNLSGFIGVQSGVP